jgi:hypothetical protein
VNISPEERTILDSLDRLVWSAEVRAALEPIAKRVRYQLAERPQAVMAWEPITLKAFDTPLPPEIRSAWIFVLRAGVNTGPERHPNSHQRMMSLIGSGDLQTREDFGQTWVSNVLVSDRSNPLEHRWVSIPRNVWHQPVVPPGEDWAVVSFHTVTAAELIEERPQSDGARMKQMHYVDRLANTKCE